MVSEHKLDNLKKNLKNETGSDDLSDYKYAGGNYEHHERWYQLAYQGTPRPDIKEKCYCETPIKRQCYVEYNPTGNLYVVGSCCITRWMGGCKRKCKNCDEEHKNRTTPYCNDCRELFCSCGRKKNSQYKQCYYCHTGTTENTKNICKCGKFCGKYKQCYNCFKN